MDVRLVELGGRQRDLVAVWQLLRLGWTERAVEYQAAARMWQRVHSGVYAISYAPLSREQRRMAATLTTPRSYLAGYSAAAHYGIWRFEADYETIVRHGNRGRERPDGVLVRYSKTLRGDTGTFDGIPITSPERTLIDLAAHADAARALREARRLELTTPYSLAVSLAKHRTRRGTHRLATLNDRYAGLPYSRCRSNAEARALEVLHDAGDPPDAVNEEIGGAEADLIYRARMLIVEIDGPQFHGIDAEDARKQAVWEQAGYTVRRVASDDVYDRPEQLIRAARPPVVPAG